MLSRKISNNSEARREGADETQPPEACAPSVLERLVRQAEAANASDIHVQMHGATARVAFRLDGVMTAVEDLPAGIAERVLGRIKFLAQLKTYQDSMPQDGRIDKAEVQAHSDIRVATFPTVTGEKVVLRLFNAGKILRLDELGLPVPIRAELEHFLAQPAGMMLLTGPAGSGKTTTIYACLRMLAEGGQRHVITIEDPVEQIVEGVMQTEVNEVRGLDYAKAARHLLRQDPQALIIGEIRDEETANLAVRAALTGHLVISTLHAGSCQGVFERLQVLCPDPSATAAAIQLVLNQRLVRRLCSACGGAGCNSCLQTGYHGRVPLVEMLRVNETLRHEIARRKLEHLVSPVPLEQAGRALIQAGLTNPAEIRRVLGSAP